MPSLFTSAEIESFKPETVTPKAKAAKTKAARQRTQLMKAHASLKMIDIQQGETIHYATMGDWSTHNLIGHLLETTGTAEIWACTWSMTEDSIRSLLKLKNEGHIKKLHILCDWRVKIRCPEAMIMARQNFAELKVATCHAKVCVIQNANWQISIVGSANFTNNPRIEAGVITENQEIAQFHKNWISAEMQGGAPFEGEL